MAGRQAFLPAFAGALEVPEFEVNVMSAVSLAPASSVTVTRTTYSAGAIGAMSVVTGPLVSVSAGGLEVGLTTVHA